MQLRAFLIQIGRDPGAASGDELNAKLAALVRDLQEGKTVLQKVEARTAETTDPQVKALRAQAREAIEQGNLPALKTSLDALRALPFSRSSTSQLLGAWVGSPPDPEKVRALQQWMNSDPVDSNLKAIPVAQFVYGAHPSLEGDRARAIKELNIQ